MTEGDALKNFTFHNVSINTNADESVPGKDRPLHSIMFLLIRRNGH